MDINVRMNEIMNDLHSCKEELYRRDELLPELTELENEIVSLTFNKRHVEEAQLQIWDVEDHLEEMNQENGGIATEELQAFKADCKDFVNYIKGIKSGYRGEEWTFKKLEGLKVPNRVMKNVQLSNEKYRSELDAIVLTHKGAFIVEIKNTKRDIFIDENGQYFRTGEFLKWDSDIGFKTKIKTLLLKEVLNEEGFDIPITTVVLFSNSKIQVQNKCPQLKTCFLKQLNYLIEDFESEDVLTDRDMDSIAERIEKIVGTDLFPIKTDVAKLKKDYAALMAKLELANELTATVDETIVDDDIKPEVPETKEATTRRHPVLDWFGRITRNPYVRGGAGSMAAAGLVMLIKAAIKRL